MRYISTRNKERLVSASEAIIQGISTDGGLFVPEKLPKIDLENLKGLDYKSLCFEILKEFLTDFKEDDLKYCIQNAYNEKFETEEIAPLAEVGGEFLLELYHGPTLAFKDMALSILPYLLKAALKNQDENKEVVILTATSGDTGKAALEGFANVEGIKIIVFFPEDGVSEIQKRQMKTQEGDNTFVVGINGNFDDAQNGVKKLFNDKSFVERLLDNNYILSSANSINIGRLLPQIVYYFHSYLILLESGKIADGERINIGVPTGNFGNILAAFYAKEMGLPVNKLICASNENNVLTDFFNRGVYDRRRELILTSSPSMDILISSNLERLLFHLMNGDDDGVAKMMKELNEKGFYNIGELDINQFYGVNADEREVERTIKGVFKDYGYLMDTHTAVAFNACEKYKKKFKDDSITVIASTASPFKFGRSVAKALNLEIKDRDEFEIIQLLARESNLDIPAAIENLMDKEILHKNNCYKDQMKDMVEKFLGEVEKND